MREGHGGSGQEETVPGRGNRMRNPAWKRELRSLEAKKGTQRRACTWAYTQSRVGWQNFRVLSQLRNEAQAGIDTARVSPLHLKKATPEEES